MLPKHENEGAFLFILRWSARIIGLAVLLLLVLFYLGEGVDLRGVAAREYIGFLFFPVGLVVGIAVGWRDELIGGLISASSTAAFYLIYGALLSGSIMQGSAFLVFSIPGFLFLAYGLFDRIHLSHNEHKFST